MELGKLRRPGRAPLHEGFRAYSCPQGGGGDEDDHQLIDGAAEHAAQLGDPIDPVAQDEPVEPYGNQR